MAAEDEDDYMSDAILNQCSSQMAEKQSLINRQAARKHKIEAKKEADMKSHALKHRPKKLVEHERREEGLSKEIGSDNKGFALMMKMGYTPGQSIGKAGTGIKTPIAIKVKCGRGGLGEEAEKKRRVEEMRQMREEMALKRHKADTVVSSQFRTMKREAHCAKQVERDLEKSRRMCETLDRESGWEEPVIPWYWPEKPKEKPSDDTEEDDDEQDDTQCDLETWKMLETLTEYLRNRFQYCIWCCERFQSVEEMLSNCPGDSFEAHDS